MNGFDYNAATPIEEHVLNYRDSLDSGSKQSGLMILQGKRKNTLASIRALEDGLKVVPTDREAIEGALQNQKRILARIDEAIVVCEEN